VLSLLPVASCLPSGLKATLLTALLWPCKVAVHVPLTRSHTLAVLSLLPVASCLPSGLKATLLTALL
jgi:hypothetical protein